MNPKQHYRAIDYAKFLCIFLVAYFHSPPSLPKVPNTLIYLFMIPCFFFLSGLLFSFDKYSSIWNFVKHRGKQLLIPYFSFFAALYIYWLLFGHTKEAPNTPFYQPLFEYIYGRPVLIDEPLWFIACLFAMQLLFYLLFKKIKNRIVAIVALFAVPFISVLIDLSNAPWMLDNVCIYFPFYGIASLYRKEIMRQLGKEKIQLLYGFISILIYIAIVYLLTNDIIHPVFLVIALQIIESFCILFPALLIIKYIADFCGEIAFIRYIATNAIIVLALHTYVILTIFAIVSLLGYPVTFFEGKYLLKFFISAFTVFIMVVPIYIINRYFPFILGRVKI